MRWVTLIFMVTLCAMLSRGNSVFGTVRTTTCMPDSGYQVECGTVSVALDPFDATNVDRIGIKVAIFPSLTPQPVAEQRKVIFMPQGGPGVVGTRAALYYVGRYVNVHRSHDLVFFDTRGMGDSCGIWCPEAYRNFTMGSTEVSDFASEAVAWKEACEKEWRRPDRAVSPCLIDSELDAGAQRDRVAKFVASRYVVEDTEAIRVALGYGKIWYYGRSYSTQTGQSYGKRYGANVAGMVLDCSPDVNENITTWLAEMAIARRDAAMRIGELCANDDGCAADVCPDNQQECVDLYGTIHANPPASTVAMPQLDGTTKTIPFTRAALESMYQDWTIWVEDRPYYTRYVEQAKRGNMIPLLRAFLVDFGMAPDLSIDADATVAESSWAYSAYFMVVGADYDFQYTDDATAAVAGLLNWLAVNNSAPFGLAWITDAPGAAWSSPDVVEQEYFTTHDFPFIQIESDVDTQVHPSSSRAVYNRAAKYGPGSSSLVVVPNGQHVSWLGTRTGDSGFTCVSRIVERAIIHGTVPVSPISYCSVQTPFPNWLALPPRDAAFTKPEETIHWVVNEILALPEYWWWSADGVGCDHGGVATWVVSSIENSDIVTLSNCAFFAGVHLNGTVDLYYTGRVRAVIDQPDEHVKIVYNRSISGDYTIEVIDV